MARSSSTRMAVWAILFAATAPLLVSGAGDPQYGLNMITKAGKGVCWIEKLNKMPPIDNQGVNWGTCDMNMKFDDDQYSSLLKTQQDNIRGQGFDPEKFSDMINNAVMDNLKQFVRQKFDQLPHTYQSCQNYVDDEKATPAKDYSSILRDQSGGAYPWKAVAHCLMQVMESENGADSVRDLKNNMARPKPFHTAILDRENANRARHGVPALKMDPELNTRAQRYADILARKCHMEHMSKDPEFGENHPDLQYKGGKTGENLAETGSLQGSDADNAVDAAANGWYSEIKDYPWPAFTGSNARGVIGHFTASVWKSTQLVGYGVARRDGCDKVFIVARYSPGGNMQSPGMPAYKENVLPPIS
ncbi:unnamed protein product [Orchesella dallaii]|uniref:SCP domain-containing protein n=1 Tax=Orchesella dallaii TaxID=48710 RepID=A0ABP1PME0_9HEXA